MWGWWWGKPIDPRAELLRDLAELREATFQQLAQLGKPRGLRWVRLDWHDEMELIRDRTTGQHLALCLITVYFEAIEGGEMEGIEAVALPRLATAVSVYEKGHWQATQTVWFNLTPEEVIARSAGRYQQIVDGRTGK
jgi:hypothetical protein